MLKAIGASVAAGKYVLRDGAGSLAAEAAWLELVRAITVAGCPPLTALLNQLKVTLGVWLEDATVTGGTKNKGRWGQ